MRLQQVLDVVRGAEMVQHFHGGAARVLVLVLQHLDEVLDRVRVVGPDDDVDGVVLHFDLGIAQQLADALDVDRAVHRCRAVSAAARISLFGSLQLRLQRALHAAVVEARQDVDDVHARDRILALDAADQLA